MKFLKAAVFILILGLVMLKIRPKEEGQMDMASQTVAASTREGQYRLVNGTKGCPDSVIWIEQCAGFVLNPRHGDIELETEHFCHINRGLKVTASDGLKTMTEVQEKDRYVRKGVSMVNRNGLTTTTEDTLIFDSEKEQFLWEHSRDHKGHSCLYSK